MIAIVTRYVRIGKVLQKVTLVHVKMDMMVMAKHVPISMNVTMEVINVRLSPIAIIQ